MSPHLIAAISPIPAIVMLLTVGVVGFCAWKIRSTMAAAARAQREREMALVASLPGAAAIIADGGLSPAVFVPDAVPTLDDLVLPSGSAVPREGLGVSPVTSQTSPVAGTVAEMVAETGGAAVEATRPQPRQEEAHCPTPALSLAERLEALATSLEEDPAPRGSDPWRTSDYRQGWEAAEEAAARRIRHELALAAGQVPRGAGTAPATTS